MTTAATDPSRTAPADRPAVPSRATTVVVTVLFGLFGLIPAAIHGSRAEQLGGSRRPYWVAFGLGMVVSVVAYAAVVVGASALLFSASTSSSGDAPVAEQAQVWADVPAVGSCYEGVQETQAYEGGAPLLGIQGPEYNPIDCAEPVAFFQVTGVLDDVVKNQQGDADCGQFGPVHEHVWYSRSGEYQAGPVDSLGYLVCLGLR